MPIEIHCNDCNEDYRVPDDVAGKRIRCPKCKEAVIDVPAANSPGGVETWKLRSPSGEEFGPVSKSELDQWVAEGRVNDQVMLQHSTGDQAGTWQNAESVYPNWREMSQAGAQPQPAGNPYQSSPQPNYGGSAMATSDRPGGATAISILTIVGGSVAIITAGLVLLSSFCVVFTAFYNLVAGIMALIFGIQSLNANRGMAGKLSTAAVMLIICVIGCDFISMIIGIVSIVLLQDENNRRYFA